MSFFSLVAVLMLLLLSAGGTDAARLYPASQKLGHGLSFLSQVGLLQGLADTNMSGSLISYWATHELTMADAAGGYYGFSVSMDVYDFSLTSEQSSLVLINFCNAGDGTPLTAVECIQIGWEVSPITYGGDSRAHLYAYWSNDQLRSSPCLNTNCHVGFQPEAGAVIVLGGIINPVSQPKGIKQTMTIKVIKDGASRDWLVHCGFNQQEPALIGRYPKSLFHGGGLADRATNINIGGAVGWYHSTNLVPMGSGYLPSTASAASFNNFQIFDQNGQALLVNHNLPVNVTQSDTYSVSPIINGQFFYGGPFK